MVGVRCSRAAACEEAGGFLRALELAAAVDPCTSSGGGAGRRAPPARHALRPPRLSPRLPAPHPSTHPPAPSNPVPTLQQLAEEKALNLGSVRHFIVDECDKCLENVDMRADVQAIFKRTPHDKQVMMFSATLSADIRPVVKKFMRDVRGSTTSAAAGTWDIMQRRSSGPFFFGQ